MLLADVAVYEVDLHLDLGVLFARVLVELVCNHMVGHAVLADLHSTFYAGDYLLLVIMIAFAFVFVDETGGRVVLQLLLLLLLLAQPYGFLLVLVFLIIAGIGV